MDGPGSDASAGPNVLLVDNFLEHFGVKGMRWGVRRNRAQTPSSSDATNAARVHNKIRQTGGTHSLSNKELQDFITRANLEQQYSRLAHQDPKLAKGHNFIKGFLSLANTANSVFALYNSPLAKEIRKALDNKKSE